MTAFFQGAHPEPLHGKLRLLAIDQLVVDLVEQFQLQFGKLDGAFIFQGPYRNHRQPAVELRRGHGVSGSGFGKGLLEIRMRHALFGHHKPGSHLDTGSAHHQQMGHHPPGGHATGDKHRHVLHLK